MELTEVVQLPITSLVEQVIEIEIERIVEVEKIVEKIVEVEKFVDRIVEVPVEKVVEVPMATNLTGSGSSVQEHVRTSQESMPGAKEEQPKEPVVEDEGQPRVNSLRSASSRAISNLLSSQ